MRENDRRRFMKSSAALVSGLAVSSCAPAAKESEAPRTEISKEPLERGLLEAVARIVLPAAILGEAGVARVVEGFQRWLSGVTPVAELDHAYIFTDDILYGPPDPGPLWGAQLEALSLEAEKGHGVSFLELPRAEQESLVRRQIPRDLPPGLPDAARAPHVALGLLAYFYQSSEANDLCYEAAIERNTCRGLESSSSEPSSRRS
jgi:hypothetical protein